MSSFWSGYISILTLGSLVALLWLIFATRKGETPDGANKTMGHSFDGIEEYDNPLPKWWFMLFIGTIVFGAAYLALYPGLGNWKGLLPGYTYVNNDTQTPFHSERHLSDSSRTGGWTQVKQWEREMEQARLQYDPIFTAYAQQPLVALANDEQAMKVGGRLFVTYCSVCHATNAKGTPGFPNLTDTHWRWGGEPEDIKASIEHGRTGIMPGWGSVIGESGVKNVAAFVRQELAQLPTETAADIAQGAQVYTQNCAACHGAQGEGMPALGAPALNQPAGWIYGHELSALEQTIRYGRTGHMPAQAQYLGPDKVHVLAAYIYSLSRK